MTDDSQASTSELIQFFIDGANRLGSAFNPPRKMDPQSPEATAISGEMQKIGTEPCARARFLSVCLLVAAFPIEYHW
jgi:hypothetical protein